MIKYLVMDVDGTLTDGKIVISADRELFKSFNCKDGYGIREIAKPAGIEPVIITGRTSEIVAYRGRELGLKFVRQGVRDKIGELRTITMDFSTVAYIGDDCNDLPCMLAVKEAGGIIGCPRDAVREVKAIADFISERVGGDGAVREFIDWLLDKKPSVSRSGFEKSGKNPAASYKDIK